MYYPQAVVGMAVGVEVAGRWRRRRQWMSILWEVERSQRTSLESKMHRRRSGSRETPTTTRRRTTRLATRVKTALARARLTTRRMIAHARTAGRSAEPLKPPWGDPLFRPDITHTPAHNASRSTWVRETMSQLRHDATLCLFLEHGCAGVKRFSGGRTTRGR